MNGKISVETSDDSTSQLPEAFVLPITRVQIEQDTAKSLHEISPTGASSTLVDHNRSSTPLIEIITPPVLSSAHEAATAFAKIASLLKATGVSTADMHNGAMRCDVNVSLGLNSPRVEIKNLNSVQAVRDACHYEISLQIASHNANIPLSQTTKTWNGKITVPLRTKEGEKDYRYLPDADLPPVVLSEEFIQRARADLPPLPDYLISILLGPPHNLGLVMARRFSVNKEQLAYYNAVRERTGTVEGSMISHW